MSTANVRYNATKQGVSRAYKRAVREDKLREACKASAKAARKELPKSLREYQVRAARKNARSLVTLFGGEDLEFQGLFTGLYNTVDKVDKSAEALTRLANNISERLDQIAANLQSFTEGLMWRIPMLIIAYCIASHFGVSLACLGLFIPTLASYFGSFWSSHVQSDSDSIEEQSGGTDVTGIISMIATLALSCMVPVGCSITTMVDLVLRRVGSFERSSDGFKKLFDGLIEFSERIINACLGVFGMREVTLMNSAHKVLKRWMLKVDEFEKVCVTREPTITELYQAIQLQIDGIGFKQVSHTPQTFMIINKYLERLGMQISSRRGALNAAHSFRQQPIMALLGGDSAVGKTVLLKMIGVSALVISGLVPPDEGLENLWQKGTSEYWNGYVGQKCLVIDDAFQVKKPDSMSESEYMLMIRAVGNWAFPLNYADLESKGRFYFSSPLIVGTTNVEDIAGQASQYVACPAAVVRRIEYGYWVTVSPEFERADAPGKLDYLKMQRVFDERMKASADGNTFDCFPWEAWCLHPHRYDGRVIYGPRSITPKDLVLMLSDQLRKRTQGHVAESDLSRKFFDGLTKTNEIEPQSGLDDPVGMYDLPEDESDSDKKVTWEGDNDPLSMYDIDPFPQIGYDDDISSVVIDYDADCSQLDDIEQSVLSSGMGIVAFVRRWVSKLAGMSPVTIPEALRKQWDNFDACTSLIRFSKLLLGLSVSAILVKLTFVLVKVVKAVFGLVQTFVELVMDAVGWSPREESNIKPQQSIRYVRPTLSRPIVPQAKAPPTYDQQRAIYANCYVLMFEENGGYTPIGSVQFVEGTLAMMPSHFVRNIISTKYSGKLKFVSVDQDRFTFYLPAEKFLSFKRMSFQDMDLDFVSFDVRSLKSHSCIKQHFLSEKQMAEFIRLTGEDVVVSVPRIGTRRDGSHFVTKTSFQSPVCQFVPELMIVGRKTVHLFQYTAMSEKGDCGAPLMIVDNKHYGGSCYLGLHIAGHSSALRNKGYATCVTREMVDRAQEQLACYKDDIRGGLAARGVELLDVPVEEQSSIVGEGKLVDGSFVLIGQVDKILPMGTKTSYMPSPMQEDELFGPPPKIPSILRAVTTDQGVVKYPMVEGMKAYQTDLEWRDIPMLRSIVEKATQPFRQATEFQPRFILSPEEAVVSIEGLKMKKIARDTSPGYPYRLTSTGGKSKWFGNKEDYVLEGPDWDSLRDDALYIVEQAKHGVRTPVIFTDFLKDELRPIHKVQAVATRCISGAPLDYTIAVRMYFGTFLAAMFKSRIENCMAPGTNPFQEWGEIARKLSSKGTKMFAGDFSRFDASEQPYIHMEILNFINRWYADGPDWSGEDDKVREILFLDLIHSRHLTGLGNNLRYLVQWNKSLPSGHPLTTPVNSLYSLITIAACFVHLTGKLDNLHDLCYIITFGDDNVVAPSETVIDVFHQVSVSEAMGSLFGLTYTSDKKDEKLKPWESLSEVTFLQRTFALDPEAPGSYAAPLNEKSFMFSPYWYRNKKSCETDMMENVRTLLGELSQHPPAKWDEVTAVLFPWLRDNELMSHVVYTTREGAREWRSQTIDTWF